jgi:hypothetical protein
MWIFQNDSFISAVEDQTNADNLMVRARIKGDIEKAFPGYVGFQVNGWSDYPWRCSIPKIVVANRVWDSVMGINYENFKGSIPRDDNDRHNAYMSVWSVMADYERTVAPPKKHGFLKSLFASRAGTVNDAPFGDDERPSEIPLEPQGDGKCWLVSVYADECGEHTLDGEHGMFWGDDVECDYSPAKTVVSV